jgi:pyrroline-5-carboxylate reductase
MITNKLAIIGCGNIGLSLLQGFLKEGGPEPADITVTRRNIGELDFLKTTGISITADNVEAVGKSGIIIIAVKPYNFFGVLDELKDHLDPEKHILVSVTAGVTIDRIEEKTGDKIRIFRAMPNISASVGKSVSCISHNEAGNETAEKVKELFDLIGATMAIEEDLMESATILGACGVAFVLRFIRAMIQGGIQIGFDAASASVIVNHTVKGAAELLIERHQHPEFEIDKVTTPKGCTIVGLNEMEHNGFSSSLIKGIVASFEKIEK